MGKKFLNLVIGDNYSSNNPASRIALRFISPGNPKSTGIPPIVTIIPVRWVNIHGGKSLSSLYLDNNFHPLLPFSFASLDGTTLFYLCSRIDGQHIGIGRFSFRLVVSHRAASIGYLYMYYFTLHSAPHITCPQLTASLRTLRIITGPSKIVD